MTKQPFYTKASDCATHQEYTSAVTNEDTYIRHGIASALCKNAGMHTGFDRVGFRNWINMINAAQYLMRGASPQETQHDQTTQVCNDRSA